MEVAVKQHYPLILVFGYMNNKQKNIALVTGFVLMLFISYHFSFKKTVEVHNSVAKLKKDKMLLDNAETEIRSLQFQGRYLDSILESNDLSVENTFHQTLLFKVSQFAKEHKLKIIESNEPHSFPSDGSTLLTYTIEVQGSFRDLLLFSNDLEQQRLGKLSSLTFTKKRNYRTGRNYLIAKLILQRYNK